MWLIQKRICEIKTLISYWCSAARSVEIERNRFGRYICHEWSISNDADEEDEWRGWRRWTYWRWTDRRWTDRRCFGTQCIFSISFNFLEDRWTLWIISNRSRPVDHRNDWMLSDDFRKLSPLNVQFVAGRALCCGLHRPESLIKRTLNISLTYAQLNVHCSVVCVELHNFAQFDFEL